jgi:acetyl esterase/lipase
MHRHLNIVLAIAVSFVAISAIACADGMPPDIAQKIAALGRGIAVPQTDAIYAPLHPMDPYPGVKVARDIKYGPADLNLLDVMAAENAADAPRPVLVLVHGGGFSRGTKKVAGSPFLDNIPLWAARNGMVGVNVDYRLAPQSPWPSGPEDMAAIVHWLKANIARYGGDPSRIYMMGWSAGANHVASYVAFPEFHAIAGSGLAGAILLSGSPFDPTVFDMTPYKAYFGDDASKFPALSPTPGLLKTTVPLMVVYAGLDPPGIERESINLIETLCNAQRCPQKVFLKTHSHISEGDAIGTSDTELTDQLLVFMKVGKPMN